MIAQSCFFALMLAASATGQVTDSAVWKFATPAEIEPWTVQATGEAQKRMPAPKVEEGHLTLLDTWWRSTAAAAVPFAPPPSADQVPKSIDISWTVVINTGTEGMGMAWLDFRTHGRDGIPAPLKPEDSRDPGGNMPSTETGAWGWEAPNLRAAFGIGLDASNPVNRDPFRGSGNAYDRPQHEISLHWDGLEIAKKTARQDFRDGQPHRVRSRIQFQTGGAEVSLWLDGEPVFDRLFIAGMLAYHGRAVFGARNADTAGDVSIDDVTIQTDGQQPIPANPTSVPVFTRALNDAAHGSNTSDVDLPPDLASFGRIIATLRLDKPESRFDPWDRLARIWIEDPATHQRFELLRYITPYHRGFEWKIDVSDFRSMLSGKKRFVQECGTYGEGWLVSLRLDFYPGPSPDGLLAAGLVGLWCGEPVIGDPDNPPSIFYTPREVPLEDWVAAAKVRMVVTGHGGLPNTNNAAEFMPIDRTLTINGQSHTNRLWKSDCYLNPCRPQGGTWKYDRAGWAPGDTVPPWEVMVSHDALASRRLNLAYQLADYVNVNRGQTGPPNHVTQSVLVLYRKPVLLPLP